MDIKLLGDDKAKNERLEEILLSKKITVNKISSLSETPEFIVWSGNSKPTCDVHVWQRNAVNKNIHIEYHNAKKDIENKQAKIIAVKYQGLGESQPLAHICIGEDAIIKNFISEYDFHLYLIDMIKDFNILTWHK